MLVRLLQLIYLLSMISMVLAYSDGYELNDPPPPCSPYEMMIVNTRQCVRRCSIVCLDGICYEDGNCPCDNQYRTSFTKGLVCAASCLPGCKEAGGYCASPDLCICRNVKHYVYDAVARRCRRRAHRLFDPCRGRCIHGRCAYNGQCICAQGYQLRVTLFGQVCTPVCEHDCGPKASCYAPNLCACRHKHHHYGWHGRCTSDY